MNFVGKFDAGLPFAGVHPSAKLHADSVSGQAPSGSVVIKDAQLLFTGDYRKAGLDLVISRDGQEVVVPEYFKGDKRAALASPDGAHLTGDIVSALAGHAQYAQTADGSASTAKVIGHVTKLTGNATVIRNGVSIVLNMGDTVNQGDVVQSGSGSTLGITFIDGSVFGLGSNARMVLNEMVYDPNGSNNSSLLSLVQGTISFVAGATAKHGDMKVDTPVATMGIRGTAVLVEIDFEIPGSGTAPPARFQVLVEPDGTTGSYVLLDKATLSPIATVNQAGTQTTVSGQGVVTFLSSAQLSPEAQEVINKVFALKFTESNPNSITRFSDIGVPQNTFVQLANGDFVNVRLIPLNTGDNSTPSAPPPGGTQKDRVPGPPTVATFNAELAEKTGLKGSSLIDSVSGGVTYAAINVGDVPTLKTAFNSYTYGSAQHQDVTSSLTAEQKAAIDAVTVPLTVAQDPAGKNTGTATWTYDIADHALDFLAEGEELTLTYVAEVANNYPQNNEKTFKTFTITITGTNDVPVIETTSSGFLELPGTANSTIDHAGGTITFEDVDLTDRPTVTTAFDSYTYRDRGGHDVTLALTNEQKADIDAVKAALSLTPAPGNGHNGSVNWSYDVADHKFDFLAAGEVLTLTYIATVDDHHGGTATVPVTVTVTGTNDVPTVATTASAFTERPGTTGSTALDVAQGTVTFTDVDLTDRPVVTTSFGSFQYLDENGNDVTPNLTPAQLAAIDQVDIDLVVVQAGTGNNGTATWTYSIADSKFDFLADGETLILTYVATVDDGHGGVVSTPITITVTGSADVSVGGTNDLPVVTTTDNAFVEAPNTTGSTANDQVTGSITFTDPDLSDTHSVTIKSVASSGVTSGLAANGTVLNWLSLGTLVDSTNGATGSRPWTFKAPDNNFDYLAKDEVLTLTYTIEVDDHHGGVVTKPVVVTITGTNDLPIIDSGAQIGSITETADLAPSADADPANATGTIIFDDVDLSDVPTASITASSVTGGAALLSPAQQAALLDNLSLTPVTDNPDGSGSVGWTYSANNGEIDFLGDGDTVQLTFTVTVDDNNGGTATQDVVITIHGTNDLPIIDSGAQSGSIAETADLAPSADADPANATGTITFDDVDLSDVPTASITASSVTGGAALLSPAQQAALLDNLSLTPVTDNPDGSGSVGWTYSANNGEIDFLGDGDTVQLTFTVTVNDNNGGSATQDVVITIHGTNDAPTISTTSDAFSELPDATGSSTPDTASGTISFTDVDLIDEPEASAAFTSFTYTDAALTPLTPTVDQQAAIAAVQATLTLTPAPTNANNGSTEWVYSVDDSALDFLAADEILTLTYTATVDDGHTTVTKPFTVTITGTNDAPTLDAGTLIATAEDSDGTAQQISDIFAGEFQDVDNGASLAGIAVTGADTAGSGAWWYSDNGSSDWQQIGSVSAGSALVLSASAHLKFVPAPDYNGTPPALTVYAIDNIYTGSFTSSVGGTSATVDLSLASSHGGSTPFAQNTTSITTSVTAVNDAPVNTVPGAQSATEDTALIFSSANGNAISVSDVDAGSGTQTVTLTVSHGILTLSQVSGLTFTSGGDGEATMTFSGTLSDINAALSGLSYQAVVNYSGSDTLTIATSDDGNTGAGGTLTDGDSVAIDVAPVADAPALAVGAGAGAPVGSDQNIGNAGYDTAPITVALADGGYAVTWASWRDGDYDVYTQVFEADGSPRGPEERVDNPADNNAFDLPKSVAALPDGGYVITWVTERDGDGDAYTRIYNADGTSRTAELLISEVGDNNSEDVPSAVVALGNGGYAVTWIALLDGDQDIYTRVYDADGIPVGSAQNVSDPVDNNVNDNFHRVTALTGGGYAVTWYAEHDGDGNSLADGDVYTRVYDANGAPLGPIRNVSDDVENNRHDYLNSVTALPDGGYVIAWYCNRDNDNDTFVRVYDANGVPVGGEINASDPVDNDNNDSPDHAVGVTVLAGGRFAVTWDGNHNGDTDIFTRVYEANGTPVNAAQNVSDPWFSTSYDQAQSVVALSNGDYVVTWVSDRDGDRDVYIRVYSQDGLPVGAEQNVSDATDNDSFDSGAIVVSLADGGFVVAWDSNRPNDEGGPDVFARVYNADGTPRGTEFNVSNVPGGLEPGYLTSVTALTGGDFAVTWTAGQGLASDVHTQVFHSGTTQGNEDCPITLPDISAALADPSETLSLTITGFPAGTTFNIGTLQDPTHLVLDASEIASLAATSLALTTPENFNGVFALTAVAISTEADGSTASSAQTFHVNVAAVNDAPVITSGDGDTAQVSILENTTAVTTVEATDIDSANLTYAVVTEDSQNSPDGAKFTIDPVTGVLSFITAPDYELNGSAEETNDYTVQVKVSDGAGGFDIQTLTVTVTDVGEVLQANADTVNADADTAVTLSTLTANDSTSGGPLTIVSVGNALHGTVTLNGGNPVFTPDAGFTGQASFTYWVTDASNTAPAGTFQSPTTFAAGAGAFAVATADLNGDGKLDLVVTNNSANANLSVLLGNGDGTFGAQTTIATGVNPFALEVRDIDGDNDADIVVANLGSNTLSVLLGDGNGSFAAQQTYSTGTTHPEGVRLGDFNGDGKIDVVTTGASGNNIALLLGNGDGTFGTAATFATGGFATDLAVGDFNSDDKLDVVVTNYNTNTVSLLLGNGAGGFSPYSTLPVGAYPLGIISADFNRDGNLDFAAINNGSNNTSIFIGNGDGTFQTQLNYPIGSGPSQLAAADFDQDGTLDLVVTNDSNTVSVFHGNGDGTFAAAVTFAAAATPGRVTTGDVNGDGLTDIIVADSANDTINVLLNGPAGASLSSTTVTVNVGPVFDTEQFTTSSAGGNTPTNIDGLSVNYFNAAENLTLTVATEEGPDHSNVTPLSASGDLAAINANLGHVVYSPGTPAPDTDMITFTVSGASGSDTVNFIFNQAGTGPVSLQGTGGKDVIFGTESSDTLTGGAARDQFVFSDTLSGTVQHVITDFETPLDKIDLRAFSGIESIDDLIGVVQQGSDTLVQVDANDYVLLENVLASNVHASNFIFHHSTQLDM